MKKTLSDWIARIKTASSEDEIKDLIDTDIRELVCWALTIGWDQVDQETREITVENLWTVMPNMQNAQRKWVDKKLKEIRKLER